MSEPAWLRGDEPAAWLGLAHTMLRLPAALDRQLREEAGISHAYYLMMAVLSDSPDRSLRMSELARATGTSPSRLSHAVTSLQERGWVERRACREDGRGQVAALTDAGHAALVQAAPSHVAEVRRRVFDRLDAEEVRQLAAITRKVLEGLEDDGTPVRSA